MRIRGAIVVGGTSGLGLEIAKLLATEHRYAVMVLGRTDPKVSGLSFTHLDIGSDPKETHAQLMRACSVYEEDLTEEYPIDLVVWATGFYQEGTIATLDYAQISKMCAVGLVAPSILLGLIVQQQRKLPGFIAITSTSQWTPRQLEPVYTASKAGLAMLANSFSLDPAAGKVLVAAPAGMNTPFWRNQEKDLTAMLDPIWVAREILKQYDEEYKYRFVKILRNPAKVHIEESRS